MIAASILETLNKIEPARTLYTQTMGVSVGAMIAWVVAQTSDEKELKKT